MRKYILIFLVFLLIGIMNFSAFCVSNTTFPEIPNVKVRFGISGTVDHTTMAIGLAKGWFKEVGIDIEDITVVGAGRLPALLSGGVDVLDYYANAVVPSLEKNPDVRWFFSQDMFYGYAIMGKPEYKTYKEFVQEGFLPKEAFVKAVTQMKGKTFLYSEVPSTMGFQDIVFKKGGITLEDTKGIQMGQEKHIGMMFAGQAEFEVGNVPTRVTLQTKGFKPIVTARDIIEYLEDQGELGPDSEELTMIGFSGWMTTRDYYEKNYDVILRLTGVGFRIMQFMNEYPEEALKIHLEYVNKVAGTNMGMEEGLIVYNSLDPFRTFDYQERWYYDDEDYEYWRWVPLAVIKSWEKKGMLTLGRFIPESFFRSQVTYNELSFYKEESKALIWDAEDSIRIARSKGVDPDIEIEELIEKAKDFLDNFNYLDAYRYSKKAKELVSQ